MKRDSQSSRSGPKRSSRREFLGAGGKVAAASVLAGVAIPTARAAEDSTIRLALIGSGGRGSGAVANAMDAPGASVRLVAMADLFERRLTASHKALSRRYGQRIDVPAERRFLGFDAYRKAIDCLRPGDVAMLTGYAGWRPLQLEYAVAKGVNVFMEKSFACDPPGVRRVIRAGEAAAKKNLKIAAGLMCRHSPNRQALIKRIRAGEMGTLQLIRAYRMQGIGPLRKKPAKEKELHWQIRNFTRFFWVSGGLFSEMDIHQIDEICWLKDAWPVAAHGLGGRAANSTDRSQNHDSYSVEFTFADGTKATMVVRYIPKCHNDFATYVHGTKCAAQFSGQVHAGTVRIYKDQRTADDNIAWQAPKERFSPWQEEWNVLLDAIRNDRPHNEARRAALSNLAAIMARAAVHSGKIITREQAMASPFQFCPNLDKLDDDTPPPLTPDAQGRYPVPIPGVWSEI